LASHSIGKIFKVTSFGESHGKAIGVVIDGVPARIEIDYQFIQYQLSRRRPGQSNLTTSRNESDEFEIISGVFENKSTGHPITILIANKDAKSGDYEHLKNIYRPSHADFTYEKKYGIRDFLGGGRASARITSGWVAAGALAQLGINQLSNIEIKAYVSSIHQITIPYSYRDLDLSKTDTNEVRCPDEETAQKMIEAINKAQQEKDSLGGTITCIIKNLPIGLGEPVFDKLNANLAKAMFSINAVKAFEIGDGFDITTKKGSEVNDSFITINENSNISTSTNFSGGIQGGISNGEDIVLRVAFKPTATIGLPQQTLNNKNEPVIIEAQGRHDPCVLPRAVPIVEAMAALVLFDHILIQRSSTINQ
jgi:chorismate synthase